VLKEKPPGRGVVRSAVRTGKQRERVHRFMEEQCRAGRQAYVVLPVIEETERADLRAATTMAEVLRRQWSDLRIGLVHGRLKPGERDTVMGAFREGSIHVLVATTIIEVGIDVPNATIMVIEHPERFGLAQLHQLRGRIGRGAAESHCILMADQESERLRTFAAVDDGFRIAELDLEERREGDLMGERQSGSAAIRIARFPDDTDLLTVARDMARQVLDQDPLLDRPGHSQLRSRALLRYPRAEALFRVG